MAVYDDGPAIHFVHCDTQESAKAARSCLLLCSPLTWEDETVEIGSIVSLTAQDIREGVISEDTGEIIVKPGTPGFVFEIF